MTVVKPYWRAITFVAVLIACGFVLHYLPLSASDGLATQGVTRRIFAAGAALFVLVLVAQWLWEFRIREATAKSVAIGCLTLSGPLMLFLLPPFQGPDEPAHWRAALLRYRPGSPQEIALFNLPEILDTHRLRFVTEEKMNAATLRRTADDAPPPLEMPVTYAGFVSYPSVALVSFFFPSVRTLHESLLFYYLCRAIPFMLLIGLLYYVHRRYHLPCTFIWFLSLPLVLQASIVITADTLVNIGIIVAVLLMLRLREMFSLPLFLMLIAICLALTYAKFVVGGILLLPLLLISRRKFRIQRS
jgi:hypothetical protein